MRLYLVWLACVLGCGSVAKIDPDAAPTDAVTADVAVRIDAANVCTVHDTIDSCGATCAACPTGAERTTPTCDGTACGLACVGGAPRCSDNSCSRLSWTFASNMVDGITLIQPTDLAVHVQNRDTKLALSVLVPNLEKAELQLRVPVCLTGTTQLQNKTLSVTVYLEESTPQTGQYYIQAAVPRPMTGAFLTQKSLDSRVAITYTAPLSLSQFANTADQIVLQIGTYGQPFTGLIWIDDIEIQ